MDPHEDVPLSIMHVVSEKSEGISVTSEAEGVDCESSMAFFPFFVLVILLHCFFSSLTCKLETKRNEEQ